MTDRERLRQRLREAMRSAKPRKKPRKIVCYDAAWAGLPRVTVLDPPRRRRTKSRLQPIPRQKVTAPPRVQYELGL